MPASARRKAPTAVALDEEIPSINMLLYGKSGVGKTVFAAGRAGAQLTISCEKDKGMSAKRQGGTGKYIRCADYEDFLAAIEAWEAGRYGNPEWTAFESLTSIQAKMIDWILEREFGKQPETRKRDVLQIQDHLEYQNATRRLLSELCDVPRNKIFTAQDMNVETDGGDESVLPFLDGKKGGVANYACGMMTCVGYMKILHPKGSENVVRRTYWQPRPPYFAKDWTDSLGAFTDDLTLDDVWKRIKATDVDKPPPRPRAHAPKVQLVAPAPDEVMGRRETRAATASSAAARRRARLS